jgi:hypothetical protein
MKIAIAIATTLLIILTPTVFGLAAAPPSIFLGAEPASQDIPAGASGVFTVSVYPQGKWDTGYVDFELVNAPAGVTAAFDPERVTVTDVVDSEMTVTIASDAPLGSISIDVRGSGMETQSGTSVESTAIVKINVVEASENNVTNTDGGETATVTSTITTSVTTTVESTETIINTERPETTGAPIGSLQQPDPTIPMVALVVVVVLIIAAILALRGKTG